MGTGARSNQYIPKQLSYLQGIKIALISGGASHSVLVTGNAVVLFGGVLTLFQSTRGIVHLGRWCVW